MPKYTTLQQIQSAIRNGDTTLEATVAYYLSRIEATQNLNAYVEVFKEEALQRARELDAKFQENPDAVGRLFGMVISIKDVLCYKDHKVTAASKILEGFESLFSATAEIGRAHV